MAELKLDNLRIFIKNVVECNAAHEEVKSKLASVKQIAGVKKINFVTIYDSVKPLEFDEKSKDFLVKLFTEYEIMCVDINYHSNPIIFEALQDIALFPRLTADLDMDEFFRSQSKQVVQASNEIFAAACPEIKNDIERKNNTILQSKPAKDFEANESFKSQSEQAYRVDDQGSPKNKTEHEVLFRSKSGDNLGLGISIRQLTITAYKELDKVASENLSKYIKNTNKLNILWLKDEAITVLKNKDLFVNHASLNTIMLDSKDQEKAMKWIFDILNNNKSIIYLDFLRPFRSNNKDFETQLSKIDHNIVLMPIVLVSLMDNHDSIKEQISINMLNQKNLLKDVNYILFKGLDANLTQFLQSYDRKNIVSFFRFVKNTIFEWGWDKIDYVEEPTDNKVKRDELMKKLNNPGLYQMNPYDALKYVVEFKQSKNLLCSPEAKSLSNFQHQNI